MSIDVLPLTDEDIESVITLGATMPEFQTGTDTPNFYSRDTLIRWVESPNGAVLVAKEGDKLAGFLLGQAMGGSRDAYVNNVAVALEFRGRGVASELIRTAEKKFAELGCNHIFFVTNEENLAMQGLARELGYQVGDERMLYVDKMIEPWA